MGAGGDLPAAASQHRLLWGALLLPLAPRLLLEQHVAELMLRVPQQSPQPRPLSPWAQGLPQGCEGSGAVAGSPPLLEEGKGEGERGVLHGPLQPQPWGGACCMFPGEKGKARTCSRLQNPSTAGQEDRAQQRQAQGGGMGAIWHGICVGLCRTPREGWR